MEVDAQHQPRGKSSLGWISSTCHRPEVYPPHGQDPQIFGKVDKNHISNTGVGILKAVRPVDRAKQGVTA